ncbi:hypothetical protein BLL52_3033 [Rhodoferax antarcticus ANT.BR]|uniref:Uncharacterized protein n=1 Tax=Rhodoferax antarcticus ANT.BR TaxID=1111071 RepID=A0A1Q8YFK9_9BURK|nr:hypothetical protein BLL52_3033 [Rhodoferax antarcticus ANT.BR]
MFSKSGAISEATNTCNSTFGICIAIALSAGVRMTASPRYLNCMAKTLCDFKIILSQ